MNLLGSLSLPRQINAKFRSCLLLAMICLLITTTKTSFNSSSDEDDKVGEKVNNENPKHLIETNKIIIEKIEENSVDIEFTQSLSPKYIHPSVNSDIWPDMIKLLIANYGKTIDQLEVDTFDKLISYLEAHLRQSSYLDKISTNGNNFGKLGNAILAIEKGYQIIFQECGDFLKLRLTQKLDGNNQDQYIKIPNWGPKRLRNYVDVLWSHIYVLCALYMVEESETLRTIFNQKLRGTSPSRLAIVLENYSIISGYQGEQLEQRIKIIKLAIDNLERFNSEYRSPANKTSWHDLIKFIYETDKQGGGLAFNQLKKLLEKYLENLDVVKSVNIENHGNNENNNDDDDNKGLCGQIEKTRKTLLNLVVEYESVLKLDGDLEASYLPNSKDYRFNMEAQVIELTLTHCALCITNESPLLSTLMKLHLDKDTIPELDMILEEFSKNSGYQGEELEQRVFILRKAFEPLVNKKELK